MTRIVALYPRWWRDRYGDDMAALLEFAPARPHDRVDPARGAGGRDGGHGGHRGGPRAGGA